MRNMVQYWQTRYSKNPYGIGYATVVACARAVLGQGNEAMVSTGYTWVTKDNMNKDSIKKMLY